MQAQIVELLRSLQAELSFTTILITHNLALVKELCERTMVMYAGQLVEVSTRPKNSSTTRGIHTPQDCWLRSSASKQERRPARSIDGVVPSPLEFSPGCRFVERCENAGRTMCGHSTPLLESKSVTATI